MDNIDKVLRLLYQVQEGPKSELEIYLDDAEYDMKICFLNAREAIPSRNWTLMNYFLNLAEGHRQRRDKILKLIYEKHAQNEKKAEQLLLWEE